MSSAEITTLHSGSTRRADPKYVKAEDTVLYTGAPGKMRRVTST